MKTCNTCKEEREDSDFYDYNKTKCKPCLKAYWKEWFERQGGHPEFHKRYKAKRNANSKAYYWRHREEILEKARQKYQEKKAQKAAESSE